MDHITNATLPWNTNYNLNSGCEFNVSTTSQNCTDLWAFTEGLHISTEIFNASTVLILFFSQSNFFSD